MKSQSELQRDAEKAAKDLLSRINHRAHTNDDRRALILEALLKAHQAGRKEFAREVIEYCNDCQEFEMAEAVNEMADDGLLPDEEGEKNGT